MSDEERIRAGNLPKPDAQTAFNGSPDVRWSPMFVRCMWYDTTVDPNRGYFAHIQANNPAMEPLVGEVVRVRYKGREINVYVLGGADLPFEFALTRRAFLELDVLTRESVKVRLDVLTLGDAT